jgi:hypothetical protein
MHHLFFGAALGQHGAALGQQSSLNLVKRHGIACNEKMLAAQEKLSALCKDEQYSQG